MTPVEFKPAIAAIELSQTQTLYRAASGMYSNEMQLMYYDIILPIYLEGF